ncbi:hypothetical protein Tbd_0819 [Thiobacillus denitrificans ATCC 25259]|uniref:Uncharacterized protein n=1 Tax=Thiobacillus denitrificans (strain ATCC 25259 / T1) TaxID=292415 RepID=Q3SKK7_THIDA|nr:hypothetical protein Tbd_0819 [Thiobacillus denitrificans ATCC 25259]
MRTGRFVAKARAATPGALELINDEARELRREPNGIRGDTRQYAIHLHPFSGRRFAFPWIALQQFVVSASPPCGLLREPRECGLRGQYMPPLFHRVQGPKSVSSRPVKP